MTVAPSARMKELLREFVDEMETEFVKTGSLAGVRAALAELLHVEACALATLAQPAQPDRATFTCPHCLVRSDYTDHDGIPLSWSGPCPAPACGATLRLRFALDGTVSVDLLAVPRATKDCL